MLSKLLPVIFLLSVRSAQAQYKNDNVSFKTVDWTNLCNELQNNKGYLLLDVRSSGEYSDTSQYASLNIGHLKGAENISVQQLGKRLSEIDSYKNKPVFVYCSHSQRSRRASKMLADSGFTNVFNINGGMTEVYYTNAKDKDCLQSLLVTNDKYSILSPADLCNKLSGNKNNVFVLDVRSDSAFRHISMDAQENAYGVIKNSMNISLANLEEKISSIPHDKEIVVIDLSGGDAARAASLLKQKGFEKVSMLIEGIDRWLSENDNAACKANWYISPVSYQIINTTAFAKSMTNNKDGLLLDVRTADEFTNKHKDGWRNIGHLKNAVNIPAKELSQRMGEINGYKNKPVFLYDFSGSSALFEAAGLLQQQGFTNVNVLVNGLFDIRWTAANRNQPALKDLLTDVPDYNL
jgi:rhodanese-related sulfurtransferase